MRVAFLLIAAILLQGTGNLCLRQGMKDLASTAAEHPIDLTALVSPLNMTGVLLLVGFFAIFTTVLARADLSVVVPIVSFEIVVNVALAHLVIHEEVSVLRWAGTLLITLGVALRCVQRAEGRGTTMIGWILLAVMTISDASSDVLLSHGTKQVAQAADLRRWDILGIVARAFQNVNLVGAAILAAIHFGVFIALLSLWDLSLVVPMGALDYALVTVAARYLLGEEVGPMRWAESVSS